MPAAVVQRDEIHKGYIDLDFNELRNAVLQNLGVDPGTPEDGLVFYRTDTDKIRARIAGVWQDIATMADVTAGGISSGIVDAKGDLIVADAPDSVVRLPAGADGTLLVAASGQATGLQWRVLATADLQEKIATADLTDWPRTAALDFNGQKITGLANGTAASDAATFGQVSAATEGKSWKDPVRAASTANLVLSGTQTVDSVALVAGDRVLAKDQTDHAEDGIYVVAAGAWARGVDVNTADEADNATVLIEDGTDNKGDVYTQTADIVTIGVTPQNWVKSSEGNTVYTADGVTLELVGQQFRALPAWVATLERKVVGALTGGTNSEVITHNLNTRDVSIMIRNNVSPWDEYDVYSEATTEDTLTVYAATGQVLPVGFRYKVSG